MTPSADACCGLGVLPLLSARLEHWTAGADLSPLVVITATDAEHPALMRQCVVESEERRVKNNAWILTLSWWMLLLAPAACSKGQENGVRPDGTAARESAVEVRPASAATFGQRRSLQSETTQISQYIRRIFQDKAGNLWFGTNDDGVVRYDGNPLHYFSVEQGLAGRTVRGIVQDRHGDLWLATSGGVSRYDGKSFRNFTARDGLPDDEVWSLLLDRSGVLWIGTANGVSRYDGNTFSDFELPEENVADHAAGLMWSIVEDREGNIWFGSNGRGVFRYDGAKIVQFSRKDGLGSDIVQAIMQDRAGVLWFGTRDGGLSRYDGIAFVHSPMKADADGGYVWTMLEDRAGQLWVSLLGDGLYRHDGKSFTRYSNADGLGNAYVQSIFEDRDGTLWVGTSGGVYRFNGGTFSNFTRADAGRKP